MNDEHDVRDLLTRVVPEQPAVDRMVGLARRRRVRRAQTAVAAGALAVVAAVAIPLGAGRFTSDDAAIDPAFDPRVAAEVYAANPCPDEMPAYEDLPRVLPDLTRVTAVRYCTNPAYLQMLRRSARELPTAAAIRASATPDALVTDLGSFVDEVTVLDEADPSRCATVSYLPSGHALALMLDDGSQALVTVDGCTNVRRPDGTKIEAPELAHAFWRRIDAQRSTYAYSATPEVPLSCTSPDVTGPARPASVSIVEAVACLPGDEVTELPVDASDLDRAWRDATIGPEPDSRWEDPCLDPEEQPGWLLARTERGDTVRLHDSPCGFLAYSTSFDGYVRYQIPTTIADLTD
jgi:hypothetical protein